MTHNIEPVSSAITIEWKRLCGSYVALVKISNETIFVDTAKAKKTVIETLRRHGYIY